MKKMIVKIGYRHFAMSQEDMELALAVMSRMTEVSGFPHGGTYYPIARPSTLTAEVSLAEFDPIRPAKVENPPVSDVADDTESAAEEPAF